MLTVIEDCTLCLHYCFIPRTIDVTVYMCLIKCKFSSFTYFFKSCNLNNHKGNTRRIDTVMAINASARAGENVSSNMTLRNTNIALIWAKCCINKI